MYVWLLENPVEGEPQLVPDGSLSLAELLACVDLGEQERIGEEALRVAGGLSLAFDAGGAGGWYDDEGIAYGVVPFCYGPGVWAARTDSHGRLWAVCEARIIEIPPTWVVSDGRVQRLRPVGADGPELVPDA